MVDIELISDTTIDRWQEEIDLIRDVYLNDHVSPASWEVAHHTSGSKLSVVLNHMAVMALK